MARRYIRDNRGRFSSVGATARGGRLRTAAGNKRATQTGRIEGAVPSGTIRPRRRGTPKAAEQPKPLTRGRVRRIKDGFPENAIAKSAVGHGSQGFTKNKRQNIARAQEKFKELGVDSVVYKSSDKAIARYSPSNKKAGINESSPYWKDPVSARRESRRTGWSSTANPMGTVYHEQAHGKFRQTDNWLASSQRAVAGRVSRYAQVNPKEFVSEVYAGLRSGQKYPARVMRQYRALKK